MEEGARKLTYPGDRTSSVGQILGPDMFGGMWVIASAFYYANGKTSVGVKPYVPSDS